ncbi:CaiB/BaiF CoA transferase family protein [Chloroflexota bacterium]
MQEEHVLSPYRVLDLTDEKGQFCGKILADLGCDVIKIEKPGRDPARNIGPFYHDIADPERSLFWFAYNTNKRSITLDIETVDGQEIIRRLVKGSDFILESFAPGHLDKLGLGYLQLGDINPRIIMTSITPFGQSGSYRDYKGPDIVVTAMSGFMYLCGDADRAPVRISASQIYLHASLEAAEGTLVAHYHREQTGQGQHVDVSAQESLVCLMLGAHFDWLDNNGEIYTHRDGNFRSREIGGRTRSLFPCKDGSIALFLMGGHIGARTNRAIVDWMDSEGMADDTLKSINWDEWQPQRVPQEEIDLVEGAFIRFFSKHTKDELFQRARECGMLVAPVSNIEDQLNSPQLDSRGFWQSVEHPDLGAKLSYPGLPFESSCFARRGPHRAPHVGEHNEEIYLGELGLTQEAFIAMKQAGVF